MNPGANRATSDMSTKDLAVDVARDSALLAQLEFELAKAKAQDGLTTVGIGIVYIVLGASMLTAAIMALLASAVAGLSPLMPLWLAALAAGLVALLIAVIFLKLAQKRLKNVTRGETAPEIEPDLPDSDDLTP